MFHVRMILQCNKLLSMVYDINLMHYFTGQFFDGLFSTHSEENPFLILTEYIYIYTQQSLVMLGTHTFIDILYYVDLLTYIIKSTMAKDFFYERSDMYTVRSKIRKPPHYLPQRLKSTFLNTIVF